MSKSFDIISVGSVSRDVFLIARDFAAQHSHNEEFLILSANTKLDVPDIANDIGGGATNSAVSFARTGLKAACLAKVGMDGPGHEIEHGLTKEKVTSLLVKDRSHQTGLSVVLKGPSGEDTILTHRGAGYEYSNKDFQLDDLKAEWLYITSLAGNMTLLSRLVKWANLQGIRIAFNPGRLEIDRTARLVRLGKQIDVMIMNHQEAEQLFGQSDMEECLKAARRAGWHTLVITDASKGAWVLDGSYVYRTGLYKDVRVIDRTGAGDAYGAGFIAAIAKGRSIQQAMSFGAANASSVISYIGATTGILRSLDVDIMKVHISVFESADKEFHGTPH